MRVQWLLIALFVGCGSTEAPTRNDPARGKADTNQNQTCLDYFASGRAANCDCSDSEQFECSPLPQIDEAFCRRLVNESTVCCQTHQYCNTRAAGFSCSNNGICIHRSHIYGGGYIPGYLHDRQAVDDLFDACPDYCRQEIDRGCEEGLPGYCDTHPCERDENPPACFDCEAFCQRYRAIAAAEFTIN